MKAMALSGAGGVGRNCRKPFRPNKKKTRPSRSRAVAGARRERVFMVFFLSCWFEETSTFSGGLDEDELGVLGSDHRETTLVRCRDPVAHAEGVTVHLHDASRRRDVGVAESAEVVLDPRAGEERGSEHARVRTNGESVPIARQAAREDDQLVGPVRLGETAGVPLRRPAPRAGSEPDLKQPQGLAAEVVLGVPNAR